MDDPRELFLKRTMGTLGFQVDQRYSAHIRESIIDCIFYTIADYIQHERTTEELHMGKLERLHSFPIAFLNCEDPHEWLEKNRQTDDRSLIMFVYDNIDTMNHGKHRRTLLYLLNILTFDL